MPQRARELPSWLRETGLLSAALPEPPYAVKYAGSQSVDADAAHETACSDEALGRLTASGVNLLWLRFFAGFGIEFEKVEMERARDVVGKLHARGAKAAARVTLGSLVPETLLPEEPEAHNWLQVNPHGATPMGGAQPHSWRARPCFNSESYLRYMERVCNLAVDCGVDAIHFDDVGYNAEPDPCRCPTCIVTFREFLRQQYGAHEDTARAAGLERFGHNNFTHIRPPLYAESDSAAAAQTPHQQEWTRFKVHTLTRALERLAAAVGKRNPLCAIGADLLRGFGGNGAALCGIGLNEQMPLVDIARLASVYEYEPAESASDGAPHSERSRRARARRQRALDGQMELFSAALVSAPEVDSAPRPPEAPRESGISPRVVSLARAVLAARALDARFESALSCGHAELDLAVQLAFGNAGLSLGEGAENIAAWLEFYASHKTDLLGAQVLAPIAVFQDTPSLAFSGEAIDGRNAVEALLLARNLPFQPLFPCALDNLTRFRCVVLPDCACLSEDLGRRFEQFVAAGGGLVAVGGTGTRDPWRRTRREPLLKALLGDEYPQPLQRESSGGRVAYVPAAAVAARIEKAVRFAAGPALPFAMESESGTVLGSAMRASSGGLLLHVINAAGEAARAVHCGLVCDQTPPHAVLAIPGQPDENIPVNADNGHLHFTLSTVRRYALVKIGS